MPLHTRNLYISADYVQMTTEVDSVKVLFLLMPSTDRNTLLSDQHQADFFSSVSSNACLLVQPTWLVAYEGLVGNTAMYFIS
jgi:hypothetical protein